LKSTKHYIEIFISMRYKKGLLFLIFIAYFFSPQNVASKTCDIFIKSKSIGKLPRVLRPSVFAGWADKRALMKLCEFRHLGFIRLTLSSLISDCTSFEEYKKRLHRSKSTFLKIFHEISSRGGKIILEISKTPYWLSSNPSRRDTCNGWKVFEAYPPKDFESYERFVKYTVNFFSNEMHMDLIYEIWAEPDLKGRCMWRGNRNDFLKLIKHFIKGAKRANPNSKIALPSLSSWRGKIGGKDALNPEDSLLFAVLNYASKTRVKEIGLKRLPIDYISFHSFDVRPTLFIFTIETIKRWLWHFGYNKTKILITEWNGFRKNLTKNAVYYFVMLNVFHKMGIYGQTFASLQDFHLGFLEFHEDYGMLTKKYVIKKPIFNAMKFLDMMDGDMLEIQSDSQSVGIIATKLGKKIDIILWNFSDPIENTLKLLSKQYLIKLQRYINKGSIDKEKDLSLARNIYARMKRLSTQKQNIFLHIDKMFGFKEYKCEIYAINDSSSNAYYYYAKTIQRGKSQREAIISAINHQEIKKIKEIKIKGLDKPLNILMEPYSVYMLRISGT